MKKSIVRARRLKVAVIHNTIAPYRHPLFEGLSKSTDLIVYYCSVKHSSCEWDLWPRKYNYKYKVLPGISIKILTEELRFNPSMLKEILKSRPNIIIIGGYTSPTAWFTFAIAKLLKIHVIYWTEGIKEPQSVLGILTRPLRILFVKETDAIVVPGRLSRSYVISFGIDAEKIFIAPNAIDNDLFIELSRKYQSSKENLKSQIGLNGKVVILCVAQLIRRKGIEYLLHAYGKLEQEYNDIALVLIGSGPLELYIKDLATSLHLKFFKIIHSGLSLKELIRFYSIADIFVLPTLEDVWGFVVNEAMACGLPVVSTQASQAAIELIHSGENGYIIKAASSDQLYDVLKSLIQNSTLRKEMGEKSRRIAVREVSVLTMVKGFLSAIEYCSKITKK